MKSLKKHITLFLCAWLSSTTMLLADASDLEPLRFDSALSFDKNQLIDSNATFTIYNGEDPIGTANIEIVNENGIVKIIEDTNAPAVGVVEILKCSVHKDSQKLASYQGSGKSGERQIDIDLEWSNNQVTGKHDMGQADYSLTLADNHFEQLCLFYLAHALPLTEDYSTSLTVFNALDTSVLERTVKVTGSASLEIAGKDVEVYKLLIGGAKINQILSITKEAPRKLVGIEFDSIPFRYILTDVGK